MISKYHNDEDHWYTESVCFGYLQVILHGSFNPMTQMVYVHYILYHRNASAGEFLLSGSFLDFCNPHLPNTHVGMTYERAELYYNFYKNKSKRRTQIVKENLLKHLEKRPNQILATRIRLLMPEPDHISKIILETDDFFSYVRCKIGIFVKLTHVRICQALGLPYDY